ncbi:MAG: hypothetical protein V4864_05515 [Pseudomonadota bacterium]
MTAAMLFAVPAWANGLGENGSWQFQTSQDKVNKGAVLDLIERKKGGYYDSFKTTINNNTYIDKQYNCSLSANSQGNSGSNGMTASTSSPSTSNSGSTSSSTGANTASNGVSQFGLPGVLVALNGATTPGTGAVANTQSNSGSLSSGVSGSSTSATTGAISADGGRTDQALNSDQNNSGAQTASVSGSTACAGPLNAN